MITRCLQQGEDAVVQHLAAKIIENVATTTGRHCKKFLTNAVGQVQNICLYSKLNADYNIPRACLLNRSPVPARDLKSNRSGF